MDKKREARLKKICDAINKGKFGGKEGDAVQYMGSTAQIAGVKRFPTGHPLLDYITGGGWPRGRIIEVFGPESGGKSTTVLHAIAEFQRAFPKEDVSLLDVEFSFDPVYANAIGVDVESLLIHQPESGEQAMNVLQQMLGLGVKLIVVDSAAALLPQAEIDGNIGDDHIALRARLLSQSIRKFCGDIGRQDATVIFTNQVYDKINTQQQYGDKTTTPGGRALRFYSSIRVELARVQADIEVSGDVREKVGDVIRATAKKNKTSPPFRSCNMVIRYGQGFDVAAWAFDTAVAAGIIEKHGAQYICSIDQQIIGTSRPLAIGTIRENRQFYDDVCAAIKQHEEAANVHRVPVEEAAEADDDKETKQSKKGGVVVSEV